MKAPKRMSSGKYIDLANLRPEDIDIEDINRSLNTIYRFTGHWKDKKPLTVAQHTVLTMHFARVLFKGEDDVVFDCLLHDMSEAYYGDVATPWKRILGQSLRDAQDKVDNALYGALWRIEAPFTDEVRSKRKVCDLLALDTERRNMWKSQAGKDLWPETPRDFLSLKDKEVLFDEIQNRGDVDLVAIYNAFIEQEKAKAA